jgi:precorrin-2 dehydrogenase/sirohydrochlorin ferrochelatase
MGYFPILIDLKKFKPLVIGGGEVATRKVQNLLEFASLPKIISPELTAELSEIIQRYKLEFEQRKYQKGDLKGFNLVFVATDDPDVDTLVSQDAEEFGAIVNFADKPDLCNFIMPSFIKRGDLIIAISTQGKAPFLSRCLREHLEKKFPHSFKDFVDLSVYFRSQLIKMKLPPKIKEKTIDEFLSVKWIDIINEEGMDYAKLLVNHLIEYYAKR